MPFAFEYFYGNEAEQFTFFRIPKVLFTDKRFKSNISFVKAMIPCFLLLYGNQLVYKLFSAMFQLLSLPLERTV